MGTPGCAMENTAQKMEITRRQAEFFTNQIYSKVRLPYSESMEEAKQKLNEPLLRRQDTGLKESFL